jgi:hypothetical protein
MTLIIAFTAIMFFFAGFVLPYKLYTFLERRKAARWMRSLIPTMIDEDKLCKGPHEWEEAKSLLADGSLGSTSMCTSCGFIPSKNLMASKISMERVKEGNKARAIELKIETEFEELEQSYLKERLDELIKEPTFEKLRAVYLSGLSAPRRFQYHKLTKMFDMENKENNP